MVTTNDDSGWKDIPGLSLWQAHPTGVLRTKHPAGKRGFRRDTTKSPLGDWRIVKPRSMQIGYHCVVAEPLGKTVYVHRLIASTFLGQPQSGSKLEVNHKNGIKTDNRLDNLEWVTRAENCRHKRQVLGWRGERCTYAKLTEDQVIEILLSWWMNAESLSVLAARFNVSVGAITDIVYNKSWRHLERPDPAVVATSCCEIPEADAAMEEW